MLRDNKLNFLIGRHLPRFTPASPSSKKGTLFSFCTVKTIHNDSAWHGFTPQEIWQRSINGHNASEWMALRDEGRERRTDLDQKQPSQLTVERQLPLHRVSASAILGDAFVHARVLLLEVGDL